MSAAVPPSAATRADRPVVSDVEETPEGRTFTISFKAGQSLLAHTSPSRITIAAVRGSGTLDLPSAPGRILAVGDFVQIEAKVSHAITAGEDGLELIVSLVENCCRMC